VSKNISLTLSLVDIVLPDQCNHHGTLFGGAALAMLDKLAFILGSKALRGPLVTTAVRKLEFRAPAPAGWRAPVKALYRHGESPCQGKPRPCSRR
jgi:acyl-CoA hydrolase